MKNGIEPRAYYEQRKQVLLKDQSAALRRRTLFGWTRLIALLLVLGCTYGAWEYGWPAGYWIGVAALAGFLRMLIIDANNNATLRHLACLLQLTEQELVVLDGVYPANNEGNEWLPSDHGYAYDLDITGKGSLYACVNRSKTEQGKRWLAGWLLYPTDYTTILERQVAVQELTGRPDWMQELLAIGMQQPLQLRTEDRMTSWLNDAEQPFTKSYWKVIRWVYPALTLTILGLYIGGVLNATIFGAFFVVFLAISMGVSKQVIHLYLHLSRVAGEVAELGRAVASIEGQSFIAPLNRQLQASVLQPNKASVAIRALNNILNRFDYRLNPIVFIPLNAFVLWDLQQTLALNKWKAVNQLLLPQWIVTLASFEALSSLAILSFNQPEWAFPEVVPEHFHFEARELGHPLIPAYKRVSNSFAMNGTGQLGLVTGSNMAGKSTFLRTVGVNVVLAMAGGPVCAPFCRVSPVKVVSSMRIADNLEDSTSTFYAELKKLRFIIDCVKANEKVFILLDEILRGTNSRDRLSGSQALVHQLIRDRAVGIIATHDLELAKLSDTYPGQIENYYFDVRIEHDELFFDYTLREGVCQTRNAELLMKQIGIEL